MMNQRCRWLGCLVGLLLVPAVIQAAPMGTAFTYQGELEDDGEPVTNISPGCDFEFTLWDDPAAGSQIGGTESKNGVSVHGGGFNVKLDFGAGAFSREARWLEIRVCCPSPGCTLDLLTPRQEVTPAPHALYTPIAGSADTLSGIACADGELPKWDAGGAEWQCAADETGGGGGGNTLDQAYDQGGAGRIITADSGPVRIEGTAGLEVLRTITSGSSIIINGANGSEQISSSASLNLKVASGRALRLEDHAASPNLIGGYSGNSVTVGVKGSTISGGGVLGSSNKVTDDYGTVAAGQGNQAGDDTGTTSDRNSATVGGGEDNSASGQWSTIGSGRDNIASKQNATVGGGYNNTAGDLGCTVGGGTGNTTFGLASTVSGGGGNYAYGNHSVVPGGSENLSGGSFSFAGGRRAKVRDSNPLSAYYSGDTDGDEGTFVWADSTFADFVSTGPDQFLIRASGGVGIGTSSPDPSYKLHVQRGTLIAGQLNVERNGVAVVVDRLTTDGLLLRFRRDGADVGSISVAAGVVSYNAFSGSHYGWTDPRLTRGTLVTMTGDNRLLGDRT